MPKLYQLRHAEPLRDVSKIWPFETGWVSEFDDSIRIVHAEFWPSAIPIRENLHPIPDAAQVQSAVLWASEQDANGDFGKFFDPMRENDAGRDVAQREGWILGFIDRHH